jgi:DNA-directed RNA polymerase specialized sigma24 family protein
MSSGSALSSRRSSNTAHFTRQRAALETAAAQLSGEVGPLSFSEDALQNAVLELLGQLPQRPDYCCEVERARPSVEAARGILKARARSRRIDEYRRDRRRAALPLDVLEPTTAAVSDQVLEERVIDRLGAREWRRTVEASLPNQHRDGWMAWRLKTEEGLDASQIAASLAISPAAVRQRLSRCAAWVRVNVPVPEES